MAEAGSRHGRKTEQLCGLDPSMTGDDPAGIVDEIGSVNPKVPNTRGDLLDLLLGVCPRVARVGHEHPRVSPFDGKIAFAEVAEVGRDRRTGAR